MCQDRYSLRSKRCFFGLIVNANCQKKFRDTLGRRHKILILVSIPERGTRKLPTAIPHLKSRFVSLNCIISA